MALARDIRVMEWSPDMRVGDDWDWDDDDVVGGGGGGVGLGRSPKT